MVVKKQGNKGLTIREYVIRFLLRIRHFRMARKFTRPYMVSKFYGETPRDNAERRQSGTRNQRRRILFETVDILHVMGVH